MYFLLAAHLNANVLFFNNFYMKKFNYLLFVFFSLLVSGAVNAQNSGVIQLTPADTLICPNQTITLHGGFAIDAGNANSDDIFGTQIINIGFPFVYYGQTYTQCVYSANNYISFDLALAGQYSNWVYTSAKTSGQLNNAIMFPFHDLLPVGTGGGGVTYQTFGQAPNRRFVIELCRVPMFSCTSLFVTDQLILHEGTNIIEMHIGEKPTCPWNGGTAVQGLRYNALETLVPGRDLPNVPWVATNDARRFTPNGASLYTIDSIPYNPQVILPNVDSSDLVWYEEGNPFLPIGNGPSVTVTPTANINYYVAVISGQNGCLGTLNYSFSDTVWINYGTAYDTTQVEICAGSTYSWFGKNIFAAGNYDTLLVSALGCDSFLRLQVAVNPLPNVAIKGSANVEICEGSSTILALANPESTSTFQWYKDGLPMTGETGAQLVVTLAGTYTVEATTNKGCKSTSEPFRLRVNPNPVAGIEPITGDIICAFDTLTLKATPGAGYDYRWTPEKAFRILTGAEGQEVKGVFLDPTTPIVLTVYNQFGCYDTATAIVYTKPCCEVFTPNAFSPNGDGSNDFFKPLLQQGQILLTMQIFDRWGKLVYNSESPKLGWNGRYDNNTEAPSDTYMYFIKYTCSDGKLYEKKESVTLIR